MSRLSSPRCAAASRSANRRASVAAAISASGAPTLLQAISGAHTDTKATTANASEPSTLLPGAAVPRHPKTGADDRAGSVRQRQHQNRNHEQQRVLAEAQPEEDHDRQRKVELAPAGAFDAADDATKPHEPGRGKDERGSSAQERYRPEIDEHEREREREDAGADVQELACRLGTHGRLP